MTTPSQQAQIAERLRRRADSIAPESEVTITFGSLPIVATSPLVATVRQPDQSPPDGYVLADRRPASHHAALHEVLDDTLPGLGLPFRPDGIFHHVGCRPCARRLPGLVEEIWIDAALPCPPPPQPCFIRAATVGPVGHLPVVGATVASAIPPLLAALLSFWLSWPAVLVLMAILAVAATALCVLAEPAATRYFLDPDAREFVLDEVAGAAIAVCFVPAAHIGLGLLFAFVTFRFFDVLKPGIQWIEVRPWRGKVAWDDVAAGFYAGISTAFIAFLL